MRTDYGRLGRLCMERLKSTCRETAAVQISLLADLIRHNRSTEYGRRYGFETIWTPGEFQKKLPISDYGNYKDYISEIMGGKKHVLTKDPVVYFCVSSQTTEVPKYVPLTEADLTIQYLYAHGSVMGTVGEYYRELPEAELFGNIFQVGEFPKAQTDNGIMSGLRSSCLYQWLDREGGFDVSDYCAPKEVLFPHTLEDLLYVKVRFALARPNISAIHGVFINRVWGIADYIQRKWDLLLEDIEQGKVHETIVLNRGWREYLNRNLPPDPARARELRRMFSGEPGEGMLKKIWPRMRYILAVGGKSFSCYMNRMRTYAGDIPIHYSAYGASEGIFGIARKVNEADAYILFPEAGFFEFLPVTGRYKENGQPWFLWELSKGEKYELVFTNRSGLYRYRVGDVVEVVDWYGQAPVVRFCYRRDQVVNGAGEKTNQEQLDEAMSRFAVKTEMEVIGYCVQKESRDGTPRYLFYMECKEEADWPAGAEEALDDSLCLVNCEYKRYRERNDIGRPRISYLRQGSFRRYEGYLAARGIPRGQSKPVCILNTADKQLFFASEQLFAGS